MPELRRESFTVHGCSLACLRGGAGELALCLPGAGGAAEMRPLAEALAAHLEVVVPDHPGFGASDEPAWLDNIHDVAYCYLDLLEMLGPVHLVGVFLGGWIALEMAVRSVDRLRSLTLAASAGIHVPDLSTGDLFTWSPEETCRRGFADRARGEAAVQALPPNVEGDDTFLKNRSAFARLAWEPRLHDPHLTKWLHRVRVPTTIVWGEGDQVLPPGYAHALADALPSARVRILPGCGHLLHLEQPRALAAAVLELTGESMP